MTRRGASRVGVSSRALGVIGIGVMLVAPSCGSSDSSDSGWDAASGAAGSSGGQPDGHVAGASGTMGGGGSSATGGTSASGGSSASDGSVGARCGASVCGAGSFCCGPQACGFCAPNGSGPFCGFECSDAGTGGTGGSGSGGSAGFVRSCDQISCTGAATCRCCPAGGPAQYCSCTTACTSNADCRDPVRPTCDVNGVSGEGLCRDASFTCCWNCF
jgi:hypothetical protein